MRELIAKNDSSYEMKVKKRLREEFRERIEHLLLEAESEEEKGFEDEVKECLRQVGVEDEDDQEECLDLIREHDPTYAIKISKKRREEFVERLEELRTKYAVQVPEESSRT